MAKNDVPGAPVAEKRGYDPNPSPKYHEEVARCGKGLGTQLVALGTAAGLLVAYSTENGKAWMEQTAKELGGKAGEVAHKAAVRTNELITHLKAELFHQ